jgi:hypothetical protein
MARRNRGETWKMTGLYAWRVLVTKTVRFNQSSAILYMLRCIQYLDLALLFHWVICLVAMMRSRFLM